MTWETLSFAVGARYTDANPRASLSVRRNSSTAPAVPTLNLNVTLSTLIGWPRKERVLLQIDRIQGLLRLAPDPAGKAVSGRPDNGYSVSLAPMHWVPQTIRPASLVEHHIVDGALIVTLPEWAMPPQVEAGPPRFRPQVVVPDEPLAVWSADRLARLATGYATHDLDALLAEINAMPGLPVASVEALGTRARADGLRRDLTAKRLADVSDEDRREAETMVLAGKAPRDLAEYFGWPLVHAVTFARAIRSRGVAA